MSTVNVIGNKTIFKSRNENRFFKSLDTKSIFYFILVCSMNVHKRCKQNVANTCGINPKHMADLLQEMVSLKHEQN